MCNNILEGLLGTRNLLKMCGYSSKCIAHFQWKLAKTCQCRFMGFVYMYVNVCYEFPIPNIPAAWRDSYRLALIPESQLHHDYLIIISVIMSLPCRFSTCYQGTWGWDVTGLVILILTRVCPGTSKRLTNLCMLY